MADLFDSPNEDLFDHELPDQRGRWGWYKLKHPETMDAMTVRRASSFGKVIGDRTALEKWGERNAVVGMSLRPDLMSLVHGKDVRRDNKELNGLIEEAKKAAGSSTAANLGTALHGYAEQVDCGRWTLEDVPPQHQPDIRAYLSSISAASVTPIPRLIERITYVPEFDVAGKFDRIFELPDGTRVIGDLKTGSVEYSWMEIEIQLALYAHGVNTAGIWDKRKLMWTHPVKVREDFGIVMHLPVGKAVCTLYRVDLVRGWENAKLCAQIHDARKAKATADPFTDASELPSETAVQVPERPQTWQERFNSVVSREEASALYREAKSQLNDSTLELMVTVAKARLKSLELLG